MTLRIGGESPGPVRGGSPPTAGSSDAVGLGAGALVLAIGLWVWATGQVAGFLEAGAWPAVRPEAVPGIVSRLPTAWPDLRTAWPAQVRASLPGPPLFLTVGAVLAVSFAVAAGASRKVWRRTSGAAPWAGGRAQAGLRRAGHGAGFGAGADTGARWAARRDLRALAVGGHGPGRLVVGRCGRRLVATEARHSLLVVGPTQSGKTTGLAIPAILEWEGPVVATSVKDDLAAATVRWRAGAGRTWVFDPTATSGLSDLAGWSPLADAATWSGAQRMASWLVEAAPARTGMSDGAFWFAAAAKLLGPLLLAAASANVTMAEIVRWNDTADLDEPLNVLYDAGHTGALVALQACAARDERIRSSVATTLETVLAPFADPAVAAATAVTDIDVEALVTGNDTLYLCGPSHEQFRVQGLFAGLVASVVAGAVDHVHRSGAPLDPPLLLVLDEAANIAPLRDLDTLASTAAGLGIQLVTVCQDLAQLGTRYGQERARTIANNHRAKLILSGVSDLTTLDLMSGLVGEAAVREHSDSADLRDGRRTRTTTVAYRRLAPTDALRRIPPGRGVLVYGHLPAVRLDLRPWYRDAALRRRVEGLGE